MRVKISTFMLVVYWSAIASAGEREISAGSYFSPVPYVDLALGVGIHKLDRSDNSLGGYERGRSRGSQSAD